MLRGKITNIESIANNNYNLLNSELDDLNYFTKNKYFDGIPPTLRKIVKGNPLTQVQDIIKTSNIFTSIFSFFSIFLFICTSFLCLSKSFSSIAS